MTDQSHPSLQISVELRSRQAQRIRHWVHARIGEMFFMMDVVYSEHDHMQTAVSETRAEIITKLDQLNRLMQKRTSELDAQIHDDEQQFDAGTPKTIKLYCSTPQSQCSATLLVDFDRLVLKYNQLWLLGILTRKEVSNAIKEWTLVISETLHNCRQRYAQLQSKTRKQRKA